MNTAAPQTRSTDEHHTAGISGQPSDPDAADGRAAATAIRNTAIRLNATPEDTELVLRVLFGQIQSNSTGIDGDTNRKRQHKPANSLATTYA